MNISQNTMKLNEFIGNKSVTFKITKWLNDFFSKSTNIKYCILYGASGCGKTTLVKLLAEEYKIDLLNVTPSDINNKDDMNNIIKSVNITSLDGSKYKLILIDDIDEYQLSYRKKLYEIGLEKKSINPIIYTSHSLQLSRDFTREALRIKLLRPQTRDLFNYLKTLNKNNLSDDILMNLSKESKSVRSAVLSLYNSSINEMVHPVQTKYEKLNSIKKRNLQDNLDYPMIRYVCDSIRGYDKDALKVMYRFAEFDWMINKYRNITQYPQDNIDTFFVNNMIEPIEKVNLEYHYKDYKNKNNEKNKKEKIVIKKKEKLKKEEKEEDQNKKIPQQASISNWI